MDTATVRVTLSTRDRLRELARRLEKSMQAVLGEAVEVYRKHALPELTSSPSPSLAPESSTFTGDPNVLAYESLDDDFLRRNAGKLAGFCDGRLVALSADRAELFEALAQEHPEEPCLVKELTVGEPRVVRFRRPRRMSRTPIRSSAKPPPAPG